MDMNRVLPLAAVPQRIAVISSATAAGYGDFVNQLQQNTDGFAFYLKLFPAAMQGEQAAESIIAALENIYESIDLFDTVAIIRGGGATAELSCFDNYDLAFHCAQFPLPIITGIGHERDESVLDIIAHTRCKTPTAAAEFLIHQMQQSATTLNDLQNAILALTEERLSQEGNRLQSLQTLLATATRNCLTSHAHRLALLEKSVQLSSPETLLKRGFTLVSLNGKIIKTAAELKSGSRIETHFYDGKISSVVK
jgi:exodeoxyribonuclease VII large subunit